MVHRNSTFLTCVRRKSALFRNRSGLRTVSICNSPGTPLITSNFLYIHIHPNRYAYLVCSKSIAPSSTYCHAFKFCLYVCWSPFRWALLGAFLNPNLSMISIHLLQLDLLRSLSLLPHRTSFHYNLRRLYYSPCSLRVDVSPIRVRSLGITERPPINGYTTMNLRDI